MLENFLSVKYDTNQILLMFPDQTGNVYLATKDVPIHTFGHWKTSVVKIASMGYSPIAQMLRDEQGRLHYVPLVDKNDVEKYCNVKSKAEKLLGVDWSIPLDQQKQKIINRALFYIGVEKTIELAHELLERSESFKPKDMIVAKARNFELPARIDATLTLEPEPEKTDPIIEEKTEIKPDPMGDFKIIAETINWTLFTNEMLKDIATKHNLKPEKTKTKNIAMLEKAFA